MAFLTEFSYRQLIERIEIENIERIDKYFFTTNIFDNEYLFYFFNQFELKRLLKEKTMLSGDNAFVLAYKEVPQRMDNLNYVLEIRGTVKYHKDNTCAALNRGFKNFFIPETIVRLENENPEKHKELVEEIRHWFSINNYTIDRYINGEINDVILTTQFNNYFPNKFGIEPITISQSDKGQFNWYIERKTTGNVGVEKNFVYNDFLTKITDLIKSRDYLCNSNTMQNLSRYDFLINKTDAEIEAFISDSIKKDFLKNVSDNFIRNYGIEKLKEFWEKHIALKKEAFSLLSEYFKWTYNFKENSFEEVFLQNFNIYPCGLCHERSARDKININEQHDRIIPNNQNISTSLNWDFIFEHKDFFNQLFSTYHYFSEKELIKFKEKLSVGSPFLVLDSVPIQFETIFGLIYNKEICWTDKLINLFYEKPYLIYAGDKDEYSYEIDFKKLPLSISEELEHNKSVKINKLLDGYGFSKEEGHYDELNNQIELLDKHYDDIFLKAVFFDNELIEIVKSKNSIYVVNKNFYSQLLKKLYSDIPHFSIDEFYLKS